MFLMIKNRRVNTDAVAYYVNSCNTVHDARLTIKFTGAVDNVWTVPFGTKEERDAVLDILDRNLVVEG